MTKTNRSIIKIYLYMAVLASVAMVFSSKLDAREMSEYPRVKLQSLDKITAHTMTFDARVGDTLKFGPLYMKVQSCQKSSPIDEPESAAFIQIWEIDPDKKAQWVFSGWMFASSPGLSPMDHPIYDVWVIECLREKESDTVIANEDGDGIVEGADKNHIKDQDDILESSSDL